MKITMIYPLYRGMMIGANCTTIVTESRSDVNIRDEKWDGSSIRVRRNLTVL